MKKPVKVILMILVIVTLVVSGFMIYRQTKAGQIDYHLSNYLAAREFPSRPDEFKDYFSKDGITWVGWYLSHGRNWETIKEQFDAYREHRRSLSDLGFFIEAEFVLNIPNNNQPKDERLMGTIRMVYAKADHLKSQLLMVKSYENFTPIFEIGPYTYEGHILVQGRTNSTTVTIFTNPKDLFRWEQFFDELNIWVAEQEDLDAVLERYNKWSPTL